MIGTDDMSSSTTGMDISESFRPEDITKSDFFDFVTATEMGIGVVGIGSVSLQATAHQQQPQYGNNTQQPQQQHATTHQQQSQNHERLSANSNMTHDGGGTSGSRNGNDGSNISNGNNSDPTLQGYEFWHTDKDASRLDTSIFEDLDRYCWQQPTTPTSTAAHQQTQQQLQTPAISTHNNNTNSNNNNNNNNNTNNSNQCDPLNISSNQNNVRQPNSSPSTTTTLQDNDGQIYTITVLNGGGSGEPTTPNATTTWLKRETEEPQLPTTLDLDSLLGNFSGYIKSEYPYDDSGFSTDGTKSDGLNGGGGGGGDVNGLSSIQQQQQQFTGGNNSNNAGQALPSLVMSGFRAGLNIGQHLAAQFQNNNNDWHMLDHNAGEQSSAESLLRSALQGKGYTKGPPPHQLTNGNGITTLMPTGSPTVKDDEMRRMLFSTEADSLAFADSTLNAGQIFDDSQHHAQLLQLQHPSTTSNGSLSQANSQATASNSILVDDMFLSLENAFSDDFDKMKRIANEVHQYCHTPPIESDYMGTSDIMMQISPTTVVGAATTPTTPTQQLQPLHSPIGQNVLSATTQPTSPLTTANNTATTLQKVTTSTTTPTVGTPASTTTTNRSSNATKATKRYKRATSSSNNNNSLNALNHNNNGNTTNTTNNSSTNNVALATKPPSSAGSTGTNSAPSSGSSSSSGNSPPTSHCNGQRKERSLHYCSICSKGFKDKYSVNVHIRTHTGEKPFACSLCGKSFRQKAHLAKHYQTHMAQKNNHGGGGGGGGGGGMVKGNGAKHHRGGAGGGGGGGGIVTQQRQQMSLLSNNPTGPQMSSPMVSNISNTAGGVNMSGGTLNLGGLSTMGLNPSLLGVTSTVVSLNGPANSACLSANILSSTNGLLTNR